MYYFNSSGARVVGFNLSAIRCICINLYINLIPYTDTMSSHRAAVLTDQPYTDPNPLPSSVPHVDELGTTSAPLKSASFFIGQHCKAVNGGCLEQSAGKVADKQRTLCCARAKTGIRSIVSRREEK